MQSGTQYIQFLPANGACNPGPAFGPCDEVRIGTAGYYKDTYDAKGNREVFHTVYAAVNSQVFVMKDEIWQLQVHKNGKNTFEPVVNTQESYIPDAAPAGSKPGFNHFRIISLKQMTQEVSERLRRQQEYAKKLEKTLAVECANDETLRKIHTARKAKKASV